jgi:hypothetical protein
VKRRIPIFYERTSDAEFLARFAEANIAISGVSKRDALQALTEEIAAAFEDWVADESKLGPGPKVQLAILRKYLGKAAQ